jgi:hypothetical protein
MSSKKIKCYEYGGARRNGVGENVLSSETILLHSYRQTAQALTVNILTHRYARLLH